MYICIYFFLFALPQVDNSQGKEVNRKLRKEFCDRLLDALHQRFSRSAVAAVGFKTVYATVLTSTEAGEDELSVDVVFTR